MDWDVNNGNSTTQLTRLDWDISTGNSSTQRRGTLKTTMESLNRLDWVINTVETTPQGDTDRKRSEAIAANHISSPVVAMKTQPRAEREKREADGTLPSSHRHVETCRCSTAAMPHTIR